MKLSILTELKLAVGGLIIIGGIIGWGKWHHHPDVPVVNHPIPGITTVIVPGSITTKEIIQYIADPQQQTLIDHLLKQNAKYKIEISSLTSSVGELQQKGRIGENGGTISREPDTTAPDRRIDPVHSAGSSLSTRVLSGPPAGFTFKDDQLNAHYTSDGKGFDYALSQHFSVVTTTGKDRNGKGVSLVQAYQIRNGSSVEIPITSTEIFVRPSASRWFIGPRIQGGLSVGQTGQPGGVAGLQWLRRGRTQSAEDTSFAFLEPALTVGKDGAKLALIPITINLGSRGRFNPFHNIWLGPSLNLDKQLAINLTATF